MQERESVLLPWSRAREFILDTRTVHYQLSFPCVLSVIVCAFNFDLLSAVYHLYVGVEQNMGVTRMCGQQLEFRSGGLVQVAEKKKALTRITAFRRGI